MASKKPAKKRTARKAKRDDSHVIMAQWTIGQPSSDLIAELIKRMEAAKCNEDQVLPPGSQWDCEHKADSKQPLPVPEIHSRLSGLASGQDRLQTAIKALIERLQCVMTKQPEPKPPPVSSSASDIGNKIGIAGIRAHEDADLIESLIDCLGV